MSGALAALPSLGPSAPVEGALIVSDRLACCSVAECRCPCGCQQHPDPSSGPATHYRVCSDCAYGWHLEPLAIRAARAFGHLPASPRGRHDGPADRLSHLLPDHPREVKS